MNDFKNITKLIGLRIRSKRRMLGFSQENVAERSDLGLRSFQRIESGNIIPNLKSLLKISKSLDMSFETLFSSIDISEIQKSYQFRELSLRENSIVKELSTYNKNKLKRFISVCQSLDTQSFFNSNPFLNKSIKDLDILNIASPEYNYLGSECMDEFKFSESQVKTESLVGNSSLASDLWQKKINSPHHYFNIEADLYTPVGIKRVLCLMYLFNDSIESPQSLWVYQNLTPYYELLKTFTL